MRLHSRVVSVVREGDAIKASSPKASAEARRSLAGYSSTAPATATWPRAQAAASTTDTRRPVRCNRLPWRLSLQAFPMTSPLCRIPPTKMPCGCCCRSTEWTPTYQKPFLFKLPIADMWCLMMNHEYNVKCDSTEDVSLATMRSRGEVFRAVQALRKAPGWENVHLLTTSSHLGLREGRRVHGRYTVTADDLANGRKFPDGVCTVRFPVDIHTLELQAGVAATDEGDRGQALSHPVPLTLGSGRAELGTDGTVRQREISSPMHRIG